MCSFCTGMDSCYKHRKYLYKTSILRAMIFNTMADEDADYLESWCSSLTINVTQSITCAAYWKTVYHSFLSQLQSLIFCVNIVFSETSEYSKNWGPWEIDTSSNEPAPAPVFMRLQAEWRLVPTLASGGLCGSYMGIGSYLYPTTLFNCTGEISQDLTRGFPTESPLKPVGDPHSLPSPFLQHNIARVIG